MSLITTPFDAQSTASEVIDGVRLDGKRAVITGATSGIGLHTALALVRAGADVTLAVRDLTAGERAAALIRESAAGQTPTDGDLAGAAGPARPADTADAAEDGVLAGAAGPARPADTADAAEDGVLAGAAGLARRADAADAASAAARVAATAQAGASSAAGAAPTSDLSDGPARVGSRAGLAGGGPGQVRVAYLDLGDRASIDAFAGSWTGPLDILVNNAGIMALPELTLTPEGWERQFAINHLGHAALTLGLQRALAAAPGARVVTVSSSAHLMSPVDFDDIHFARRPYERWTAYAQSKTAMILFTRALAKRWAADGITVNALHPGYIMTNLQRHLDDAQLRFVGATDDEGKPLEVPPGWKTQQQGAATSVLLAASPLVEGVTGRYFEDCAEAAPQLEPTTGGSGIAPYAIDETLADRLYDETLRLLSTEPPARSR
ncbi:hypothetical protein GCM10022251_68400 [Phytohabitans flavus]|uniref:Oxidoreductase n=1 Tax=Phytohabitans flavus TaxID=1076124 RepID=A0A6F8XQY7_9ACTN|nr:SDR family NAD(P)-dependent oxidoreductase [Phytohabitans flavus]BCB76168.1 hypothetical protein Pflav_025780 [Phytohabitans flavus]